MIPNRPCRLALVLALGVAAGTPVGTQAAAIRDTIAPEHATATIDSAARRTAPHGQDAATPVHDDGARAQHRFDDAARWSRAWDDPERDGWQDPQRVVDLLRLRPGMRVADIGAGTGYFNPYLSRAVGPDGLVFAADIESTLVAHMQSRAAEESTANVRPVLAAPDDPRIPVSRLDRVLLVNTYHHVDGRIGYFRRLRRLLDHGSLVVIVDWLPGQLSRGPEPVHKVTPEETMEEMRAAGYTVVERTDLRYQYVLIFRPEP